MSQVHEAAHSPRRPATEWNLALHLCRGLFDCQRITHVLVPRGQKPVLPWIGHAPALPSVSSRKAIRSLEDQGWKIDPGRGKGSHVRLKHVGKQPLTIPANRESLSPVVLKSVANALGVRLTDLTFCRGHRRSTNAIEPPADRCRRRLRPRRAAAALRSQGCASGPSAAARGWTSSPSATPARPIATMPRHEPPPESAVTQMRTAASVPTPLTVTGPDPLLRVASRVSRSAAAPVGVESCTGPATHTAAT